MSDEHLKPVEQSVEVDRQPQRSTQPADMPLSSAPVNGISPRLSSRQLFGLNNELLIEHAGFIYRLRITQANKLILTK